MSGNTLLLETMILVKLVKLRNLTATLAKFWFFQMSPSILKPIHPIRFHTVDKYSILIGWSRYHHLCAIERMVHVYMYVGLLWGDCRLVDPDYLLQPLYITLFYILSNNAANIVNYVMLNHPTGWNTLVYYYYCPAGAYI